MLAADRPPEWEGYRFEAFIECGAIPEKFSVKYKFGDRVSNRQRSIAQRGIIDKLTDLRIAYLDFSPMTTWRAVTIEQIWKPESKSWAFETNWEY